MRVCPSHDVCQHVRVALDSATPPHILDKIHTVSVALKSHISHSATVLVQKRFYVVAYFTPYQIVIRTQKFYMVNITVTSLFGTADFLKYFRFL